MKNIAIIPARGGSERIPRKNIKNFLGKPIIAYSIEAALESKLFDEVMVSTDDNEIAQVAKKHGAKVPFFRSKKNSDDFATTSDLLLEVINNYNREFKNACCIYPTAPFVTPKFFKKAFDVLTNNSFHSVFPIVKYSYPIQRSLQVENGKVSMVWPKHLTSRSQDLEKLYHDAGQFYWFSVTTFLETHKLFTDNSGYIEIDELNAQDIDNETDWKLAELKYKLIHGK